MSEYESCYEDDEKELNVGILSKFNEMCMTNVNNDTDSWIMGETQSGLTKLFSSGYGYVRDGKLYTNKFGEIKQYWKCDKAALNNRDDWSLGISTE